MSELTTQGNPRKDGVRDAVIIGSGPAGYTAAIYLGRAGYQPLVLAGALTPGGQLVNTTEVENFPGFPDGVMGPDLMDAMQRQAERFGAELVYDDVAAVDFPGGSDGSDESDESDGVKTLTLASGETIRARAVIVATGSAVRKLGVPGEERYSGHGVSYCATCDGFFFKGKPIVVVGGGDSACEEADFLSRFGSSVTLIHRRGEFRASKIMVDRVTANPKITLLMDTVVTAVRGTADGDASGAAGAAATADPAGTTPQAPASGAAAAAAAPETQPATAMLANAPAFGTPLPVAITLGDGVAANPMAPAQPEVTSIDIRNTATGETGSLPVSGLFVAIGHTPATGFLGDAVARDADGYVLVDGAGTRTDVPGVFAAGDCVDRVYRQAISAAGMGCRAALDAQAYLTGE